MAVSAPAVDAVAAPVATARACASLHILTACVQPARFPVPSGRLSGVHVHLLQVSQGARESLPGALTASLSIIHAGIVPPPVLQPVHLHLWPNVVWDLLHHQQELLLHLGTHWRVNFRLPRPQHCSSECIVSPLLRGGRVLPMTRWMSHVPLADDLYWLHGVPLSLHCGLLPGQLPLWVCGLGLVVGKVLCHVLHALFMTACPPRPPNTVSGAPAATQ